MQEPEPSQRRKWAGRRIATKIDASATSDVEELVELIAGMGKAFVMILTQPIHQWRQRRSEPADTETFPDEHGNDNGIPDDTHRAKGDK